MFSFPSFPTQSAYGAFPSFPYYKMSIPDLADLPGYIKSVSAYYANVFNYPYSNPPAIASWNIDIPNITAIPLWVGKLFLWGIGWAGAIFKYAIIYAVALVVNVILYLLSIAMGLVTGILTSTEAYTAPLGIWAIPINAAVAGFLLIAVVLGVFGLVKGVKSIAGAMG